jgi:ketosteroid isomerase-like protein
MIELKWRQRDQEARMYHSIVRGQIVALFDAVGRGDAKPVLDGFAPRFVHRFLGRSAMGGARHSLAATKAWYERLYRLLPGIRFDITAIQVAGPPWNSVAVVDWRESNEGADDIRTENFGCHIAHLRWRKMTSLTICPDTAGLAATLDRLAAAGFSEAAAPPIED